MSLPWWAWVLITLWCFPGLVFALVVFFQKPIGGLDESGHRPRIHPLRKLLLLPFVATVFALTWPWIVWSDYRRSRK